MSHTVVRAHMHRLSVQNMQIYVCAWATTVGGIRLWGLNWYPNYGWK